MKGSGVTVDADVPSVEINGPREEVLKVERRLTRLTESPCVSWDAGINAVCLYGLSQMSRGARSATYVWRVASQMNGLEPQSQTPRAQGRSVKRRGSHELREG